MLDAAHLPGCRQQASPAFFQELAAWDAGGAPRDPAVWQSVRGCLKLVTRAQLLEECPTTGLGVLLHLLLAQVHMELCCMSCCRVVLCSQAGACFTPLYSRQSTQGGGANNSAAPVMQARSVSIAAVALEKANAAVAAEESAAAAAAAARAAAEAQAAAAAEAAPAAEEGAEPEAAAPEAAAE